MHSLISLLPAALVLSRTAYGFTLEYPAASDYWVACGYNSFRWTTSAGDPDIFSVVMQNSNKTKLNDDFPIANSLSSKQGSAQVYVPCIPPAGQYEVHLVNASHYDHSSHDVFLTSPTFEIKPKGTAPAANARQDKVVSSLDKGYAASAVNASVPVPSGIVHADVEGGSKHHNISSAVNSTASSSVSVSDAQNITVATNGTDTGNTTANATMPEIHSANPGATSKSPGLGAIGVNKPRANENAARAQAPLGWVALAVACAAVVLGSVSVWPAAL